MESSSHASLQLAGWWVALFGFIGLIGVIVGRCRFRWGRRWAHGPLMSKFSQVLVSAGLLFFGLAAVCKANGHVWPDDFALPIFIPYFVGLGIMQWHDDKNQPA